jgi:hypothetical protein
MGFKALTVNTAAEAAGHIYAEDDAAIFQSMFGGDGVLNIGNCLKSTVISNNKVRISDGVLSVGGHIGRLSHADYQDMTIENGATGYNRNDIIYARFLTSGNVDSFILAVKKGTATTGTASDPALVQGNLYDGAVERDYPLYRVKLSGLSIASVDQLFTVIPTIPDLKAQMAKDKAEINQSLANGKIKFGIDSSGNYGYIKDGADTVIPFKRYEDGRIQGRNDVIGSPNSYGLYTKAQYDANKVTYKSGNYNTGLNGETWRSTSFNTGFSTIIALQINCWNDEGNGYFNAFKNVRISGGKVSLDFYAADYVDNYVQWLAVGK